MEYNEVRGWGGVGGGGGVWGGVGGGVWVFFFFF